MYLVLSLKPGPTPHNMEPMTDSPVTVGGSHRQASTPGQRGEGADRHHNARCHSQTRPQWWEVHTGKRPSLDEVGWPPLQRVEPFMDLITMVGGPHRQASMPRRRGEGAGRYHIMLSHSRTRSHWWEARIGKRPCLDRERVVGHHHTSWSRSWTRPQWWEAHTGKCPT